MAHCTRMAKSTPNHDIANMSCFGIGNGNGQLFLEDLVEMDGGFVFWRFLAMTVLDGWNGWFWAVSLFQPWNMWDMWNMWNMWHLRKMPEVSHFCCGNENTVLEPLPPEGSYSTILVTLYEGFKMPACTSAHKHVPQEQHMVANSSNLSHIQLT